MLVDLYIFVILCCYTQICKVGHTLVYLGAFEITYVIKNNIGNFKNKFLSNNFFLSRKIKNILKCPRHFLQAMFFFFWVCRIESKFHLTLGTCNHNNQGNQWFKKNKKFPSKDLIGLHRVPKG